MNVQTTKKLTQVPQIIVSPPSVWKSLPDIPFPACREFISSCNVKQEKEFVQTPSEFDIRIKNIKKPKIDDLVSLVRYHKSQGVRFIPVVPINPKPRRVFKNFKYLPWESRFEHWALKTFRYNSAGFAEKFGKIFNKGGFNRRIFQKIAREEKARDARRAERQQIVKQNRRSYLVLQTDTDGEDVPSFYDEIGCSPPPPPPKRSKRDSESWYNPNGLYTPVDDSLERKAIRNAWRQTWRFIFSKIRESRGQYVDRGSKQIFMDSSDSHVQQWACENFSVIKKSTKIVSMDEQEAYAEVQSATARTIELAAECSEAGNTIFIEQSGKSIGTTVAKTSKLSAILPDAKTFNSLSSRDVILDTFLWKEQAENAEVKTYTFPAVLQKLMKSNPTSVPYSIHTFAKSDFIIRIRANPNPFQIGQLQCSWMYDPNADKNFGNRNNIYSLSQTNHCLINAGSGNIGEIHVKYLHPCITLPTITSDSVDDSLNLGKLIIRVINPLTCPDTVAKSCAVTISIELVDATYSGAKDMNVGDFVYPQMEALAAAGAVTIAEKLLNTSNVPNTDKPPYQKSKMAMVPQSNQSFCIGTNIVEPINALRLDADGQHVKVISGKNEMTVQHISQIYGLIETQEWTTGQAHGTKIISYDASPLFDRSIYEGAAIGTDTAYSVPPVGVLSSLFSYWSGELRMRVDFVASKFHTGRLMMCYVPFYLKDITIEQAISYPYQIFDLREGNQSFTFNIPYMSLYPMYPRRTGYTDVKDSYQPPGKVHIFVMNELVAMDNVAPKVFMNIYWAAGDNFKVYVPAQPALVTSFFPDNKNPSSEIKAAEGMYPWHMGFADDICMYDEGFGKPYFVPALVRYSYGWNDITVFNNIKDKFYYTFKNKNATHYATMGNYTIGSNNELEQIKSYYYKDLYFVPIFNCRPDYAGKIFGVVKSLDEVKNYYADMGTTRDQKCLKRLLGITEGATSGETDGNPIFIGETVPTSDFEMVYSQMDERLVGGPDEEIFSRCKVYPVVESLNRDLIGEDFMDLKNLCRRYQPYGVAAVKTTTTYGDALCTFPAMPTGLDVEMDSKLSNYGRYVREGPTQIILSGFRYYSGGMRFALASSHDQYTLWVQHRPDYEGPPKMVSLSNRTNAANLLNPGYAQYMQSLKVNNILQFEIPYYRNRNCLYAQRVNTKLKRTENSSSLGQVYIGIEGKKSAENLVLTLFSSIADDFQAYNFQGFPPMIYVDDIQRSVNQTPIRQTRHQGLLDSEVTHNITIDPEVVETLNNTIEKLKGLTPSFENAKTAMTGVLSDVVAHIGHCVISPTKLNISWAFLHLLTKYGIVNSSNTVDIGAKIFGPVSAIFSSIPHGSPNQPINSGDALKQQRILDEVRKLNLTAKHQSDSFTQSTIELVSIIASALGALASVKMTGSGFNPMTYAKVIVNAAPLAGRNNRFILPFFEAVHKVILQILEFFALRKDPAKIFAKAMKDDFPLICEWQTNVELLADIRNEDKVYAEDSPWANAVEEAYLFGVQLGRLFCEFMDGDNPPDQNFKNGYQHYKSLFTKISEVRADMLRRGISAVTRREPFCIWVAGDAGIGKSQLGQTLIPKLLNSEGITYKGEPTFTIQSGVDYWNGIRAQPCLLMDDFLSVNSGMMKEQALQDFMKIKSPSQLNPNMAHLNDKNLRITPELFYINSNSLFPNPVGVNLSAFYRRRDIVIECVLNPILTDAGITMVKDNEKEVEQLLDESDGSLEEFDHLNFRIISDPLKRIEKGEGPLLTYKQMYNVLKKRFKEYRARQLKIFRQNQELYQNQWVDEEIPTSLKVYQEEHRKALQFLMDFGPAPGVSLKELFNISREFGRNGVLSQETRNKVYKLAHASKLHRIKTTPDSMLVKLKEDKDPEPGSDDPNKIVVEAQINVSSNGPTTSQAPIFMNGSNLKNIYVEPIFNFHLMNHFVDNNTDHLIENIEKFFDSVKTITGVKNQLDFVPYKITDENRREYDILTFLLAHPATKFVLEISDVENQFVLEITGNLVKHRVTFELIDRKFLKLIFFQLECNTSLDFCRHKKHYGLLQDYCRSHFVCQCHLIEETSVFDAEKNIFYHPAHPPLNPYTCNKEGCAVKKDPTIMAKWLNYNPGAIATKLLPPELLNKQSSMTCYLKKSMPYFLEVATRIFIAGVFSPAVKSLYLFLTYVLPWISVFFISTKFLAYLFPAPEVRDAHLMEDVPYIRNVVAEIAPSGDAGKVASTFKSLKPIFRNVAKLQSGIALNQNNQDIIAKLKKNTYIMRKVCRHSDYLRVFFLYSNVICFQRHYMEILKASDSLKEDWEFYNPNTKKSFPVYPQNWELQLPETNQIGYACVSEAPEHRSLLNNIASEKAHELSFGDCLIVHIDELGTDLIPVKPRKKEKVLVGGVNGSSPYRTSVVYAYDWSSPGYCCSVLLNPNLQQPIIGVHVAGNAMEGYAEPIANCMYKDWLITQIEEFESEAFIETPNLNERLQGSFIPLGKIHPSYAKHESGNTSIAPSLVSGKFFPISTAPAPLSNSDPRMPEGYSALFSGVNNMFKPPKTFPVSFIKDFNDDFSHKLITLAPPVIEPKLREFDEAIVGIPGVKFFDSLDMNTSEGFPFSRQRPAGCNNKSWLFKFKEHKNGSRSVEGINPDLQRVLYNDLKLMRNNTKPFIVFEDCLKDARLPLSKVTVPGKTRIFSTSPVQFTILFKCYFMDFMAAYMNARLKLDHAIGIAADGPEWGILASKMMFEGEDSRNFMSGDYKNFGPSLSRQVLEYAVRAIMKWCKKYHGDTTEREKEDNIVRRMLLLCIIDAVHLCHDNLYMTLCGAPSGSPITVILNEIVNEHYMYAAWKFNVKLHMDKFSSFNIFKKRPVDISSVDNYHKYVKKCGYGDDIIFNVHDSVTEIFNFKTIEFFFNKHNIGYQDASKMDTDGSFKKSLSDITFLKRSFVPHPKIPGEFLAPLDEAVSVKDVLNWRSSGLPAALGTELSIVSCAANAYSLGPKKHEEVRQVCLQALQAISSPKYLRTFDDWDQIHFSAYYPSFVGNSVDKKSKQCQEVL